MSDYSDYGFHPELEALTAEHDEMRRLAAELVTACRDEPASAAMVSARLEDFATVLARHTVREETGLFETLRRVADDEYLTRFHHDHGELIAALAEAQRDHTRVPAMIERLEGHLRIEENDMFHGAHQLLGPADWDEIDRAVAAT